MHIIGSLQLYKNKIIHFLELVLIALLFFGVGILYAEHFLNQKSTIILMHPQQDKTLQIKAVEGRYMASKNGKNYYKIICISRIKEENKIYFKTEQDAKKAGFTPSKSCFTNN